MQKSNLRLGPSGPELTSSLSHLIGTRGLGGYRIALQFDWAPVRWSEWAEVRAMVGGELEVSFGGQRFPATTLEAHYGVAFANPEESTHPASVELSGFLSDAALDQLERLRGGGEITLHLNLHGVRTGPSDRGWHPEVFWGTLEYRLSAAEWAELLALWGYAESFLVQVPFAPGERSVAAREAVEELQAAIEDMAQGNYRGAVARCRDALESAYENDRDLYPQLEYSVKDPRSLSKAELLADKARGLVGCPRGQAPRRQRRGDRMAAARRRGADPDPRRDARAGPAAMSAAAFTGWPHPLDRHLFGSGGPTTMPSTSS